MLVEKVWPPRSSCNMAAAAAGCCSHCFEFRETVLHQNRSGDVEGLGAPNLREFARIPRPAPAGFYRQQ